MAVEKGCGRELMTWERVMAQRKQRGAKRVQSVKWDLSMKRTKLASRFADKQNQGRGAQGGGEREGFSLSKHSHDNV